MSARVEVVSGPLAGRAAVLAGATLSIGRDKANDLVLEDGTVSRRHAVLVSDADGVLIRDLGSRNGITVGGKPVKEGRVLAGEEFLVGHVPLRLHAGEAVSRPPSGSLPGAAAPLAAAAATEAASRKAAQGKAFDWKFGAFVVGSLLVVATVLAAWHRMSRKPTDIREVIIMKALEEKYLAFESPVASAGVHDPGNALETIQQFRSALAFRARAEGEASYEIVHEGGRRRIVQVTVKGQKPAALDLAIPADADRREFCTGKLAEAKGLAASGQFLKAMRIARGIVGHYRSETPLPPFAIEARNLSLRWQKSLQDELDDGETKLQDLTAKKQYKEAKEVLWRMRDLVDRDGNSWEYQRLQHLLKILDGKLQESRQGSP